MNWKRHFLQLPPGIGSRLETAYQQEERKTMTATGIMQPKTISPALAAVIGNEPRARPQIVKELWAYIRENKLQDPTDKRMILADEKLLLVFNGERRVSMFQMMKLLSPHLS